MKLMNWSIAIKSSHLFYILYLNLQCNCNVSSVFIPTFLIIIVTKYNMTLKICFTWTFCSWEFDVSNKLLNPPLIPHKITRSFNEWNINILKTKTDKCSTATSFPPPFLGSHYLKSWIWVMICSLALESLFEAR